MIALFIFEFYSQLGYSVTYSPYSNTCFQDFIQAILPNKSCQKKTKDFTENTWENKSATASFLVQLHPNNINFHQQKSFALYMYPQMTDHECVRNQTLQNLLDHIGIQIQVNTVFCVNSMTLYLNMQYGRNQTSKVQHFTSFK